LPGCRIASAVGSIFILNLFKSADLVIKTPLNDVLLIFGSQFAEIAAPAPNTDDQIRVLLRMFTRIQKGYGAQAVDLQLLTAQPGKAVHQHGDFFDPLRVTKDRIGQFDRYRAAIVNPAVIDL
jgi:hypothetical protein